MAARTVQYRVVLVASAHSTNDVRIYLKEARSLAAAGYEVHLIAAGTDSGVKDGVIVHGLAGSSSRWIRFLFQAPRAIVRASRLRGSVYHLHDPELLPWIRLLPSRASLVFDWHEDLPAQVLDKQWIPAKLRSTAAGFARSLEALVSRRFDAAIIVTPAMQERFAPLPTVLVRNLPIAAEWAPAQALSVENQPYVAFVGGIAPLRGIQQMEEAIRSTTSGARLVLAGPARGANVAAIVERNPGLIRYEGIVGRNEVGAILRGARAGLVTFLPAANHVNAMPNKLFEYMSAGLPVIASDFPLWRSIIESCGCGLLVDPQDPRSISAAIDWIVANPDEAEQMGRLGRAAVESEFSWDIEQQKLLDLYTHLSMSQSPR